MKPPAFPKPVVVISKCLEFEACRYNGEKIAYDLVDTLAPHVEFKPVCPEVEIGLGTPRPTIRLVKSDGGVALVQPSAGRDLTTEMYAFAGEYLGGLGEVDGFILKNRSPTCGLRGVKVYHGPDVPNTAGTSSGLFAEKVLEAHPGLAVEDEGRLRNYRIREHFFIKLFALARLRDVERRGRTRDLVSFHATHKLVLMAYSQKHLRELGRVVANPSKRPFAEVVADYRAGFAAALGRTPRYTSVINVWQHAAGYFKDGLRPAEKAFFARQIDRYRDSRVPPSNITSFLHACAVRFGEEYLLDQVLFEPYPEALMSVTDSGKGRV